MLETERQSSLTLEEHQIQLLSESYFICSTKKVLNKHQTVSLMPTASSLTKRISIWSGRRLGAKRWLATQYDEIVLKS